MLQTSGPASTKKSNRQKTGIWQDLQNAQIVGIEPLLHAVHKGLSVPRKSPSATRSRISAAIFRRFNFFLWKSIYSRWQRNSRLWSWRDIRASPAAIAERPKLQSEAKLSLSITEGLQCPLPPTPGSHQGLTYDALSTLNDLLHLLHWLARWSSGSYAYVWLPSSRVARSFFALSKGKALMKGLVTLSMNVVFIQHYKHTHKEW